MFRCLFIYLFILPTEMIIIHRNLEASAVIQGLVKGIADLSGCGIVYIFKSECLSDFSYCSSLLLQTEISLPV